MPLLIQHFPTQYLPFSSQEFAISVLLSVVQSFLAKSLTCLRHQLSRHALRCWQANRSGASWAWRVASLPSRRCGGSQAARTTTQHGKPHLSGQKKNPPRPPANSSSRPRTLCASRKTSTSAARRSWQADTLHMRWLTLLNCYKKILVLAKKLIFASLRHKCYFGQEGPSAYY